MSESSKIDDTKIVVADSKEKLVVFGPPNALFYESNQPVRTKVDPDVVDFFSETYDIPAEHFSPVDEKSLQVGTFVKFVTTWEPLNWNTGNFKPRILQGIVYSKLDNPKKQKENDNKWLIELENDLNTHIPVHAFNLFPCYELYINRQLNPNSHFK